MSWSCVFNAHRKLTPGISSCVRSSAASLYSIDAIDWPTAARASATDSGLADSERREEHRSSAGNFVALLRSEGPPRRAPVGLMEGATKELLPGPPHPGGVGERWATNAVARAMAGRLRKRAVDDAPLPCNVILLRLLPSFGLELEECQKIQSGFCGSRRSAFFDDQEGVRRI